MTFDQAYRQYRSRLLAYARRWCKGSSIDPDDLVQETALHLCRVWDRYEKENVAGFMAASCRRRLLRMLRDANRACRGEGVQHIEYSTFHDDRSEPPAQESVTLFGQLIARIAELPEGQRAIVVGTMDGDSATDVAASRGVSQQAVSKSLGAARKKLAAFA